MLREKTRTRSTFRLIIKLKTTFEHKHKPVYLKIDCYTFDFVFSELR